MKANFGSNDCTKSSCVIQAHEGTDPSTGATGTASISFTGSGGSSSSTPAPTHSSTPPPAESGSSTPPPTSSTTTNAGSNGTGTGGGNGGSDGTPTGANSGQAVPTSPPLLSAYVGGLAALFLAAGGALYLRRRRPSGS